MSDLTVSVIDSIKDWQKLMPQWNTLLDASVSGSVFLTLEWLSAWADCCLGEDRNLFILAFNDEDILVGIAPFYIQHKRFGPFPLRTIRFLGVPEAGSDYLDVFVRKGREKEVADALYNFLMGEGKVGWDLMHLQEIPSDALFLLHFLNRVESEGKYAEISRSSYCPVARLPDTDTKFLAELSHGRRKKFKQSLRRISLEQNVIHSVIQGEEVAGELGNFFQLYVEKGGRAGENILCILQGFSDRCNGNNPVQIDMLSVNGQTVAAFLHLHYRSTLALYLMAVDKEFNQKLSLGNLLIGLCIKNSINTGYTDYDFLKGEEDYKFNWANEGKSSMQIIFWQKRPAAVACGLARLAKHGGKLLLR